MSKWQNYLPQFLHVLIFQTLTGWGQPGNLLNGELVLILVII